MFSQTHGTHGVTNGTHGNTYGGAAMQDHSTKSLTAIGYVRVSTEEQATEGVSLEAQRAKVVAYSSSPVMISRQCDATTGKRALAFPPFWASFF